MSKKVSCLFIFLIVLLLNVSAKLTCDYLKTNKNSTLPCIEISKCSISTKTEININKLSSGIDSKSKSTIHVCYVSDNNDSTSGLHISHEAYNQKYTNEGGYDTCNSAIFNLDVTEYFISPFKIDINEIETTSNIDELGSHCYTELDLSPYNTMFEAGIYNPNLNHTGIENVLLDCNTSGVTHTSEVDLDKSIWKSNLKLPWDSINCPADCPSINNKWPGVESSCINDPLNVYRINFYRINELVPVDSCSSTSCEYLAWSPNYVTPPSFHEPKYFGYMILV
jgi:hypothetical protein